MIAFDKQVRIARISRQMKQKELAARAGMKQSQLARVERAGHTPSLKTMMRLAQALDCDLEIRLVPKDQASA